MQKKLTLLRKAASAILTVTMVATLFGGITVNVGAATASADGFFDDFEGNTPGGPIADWIAGSRLGASHTGSAPTAVKIDEAHGLSAKMNPDSGKIHGGYVQSEIDTFTAGNLDKMKLSFELYSNDAATSNELFEVWAMSGDKLGTNNVFGIQIGAPSVKHMENNSATGIDTGVDIGEEQWYKFDIIYNPADGQIEYYMDGELIAEAVNTTKAQVRGIHMMYRGTGGYYDNFSLTRLDDSTSWYADETVAVGTTDLKVDFAETPVEALEEVKEKITVEQIDVSGDKMMLGEATTVTDYTVDMSQSGFGLTLANGIVADKAIRITIPGMKTFTGKTVDVIKVYYPAADMSAELIEVMPQETFDTFDPATPSNSTMPAGWAVVSDGQKVKFGADKDITGVHGLKIQWPSTSRALATYAKNVNLVLNERIEAVELSARIKFPDSSQGKNNYKMMFSLHDGSADVAGFEFQNGGTTKGVEVRAYTSDSPSYFGTGDLVKDTPAANFQYSQWNDIKLKWTPDGKVEYFVNNISLGKKSQKAFASAKQFAKIRIAFLAQTTDSYVSYDDIKLVKYERPSSIKIHNVLFADENGNIMATQSGYAPAGAKQILINTEGIDSIEANSITVTDANGGDATVSGAFAKDVYTIELSEILIAGKTYTLTVPAAVAGGYTQEFTAGDATPEIGAIRFTADGTETAEFPASGNVGVKVKIKNATQYALKGKLILQAFKTQTVGDKERYVIEDVFIKDVSDAYSGYCDDYAAFEYAITADTSMLRVLFWDGYDSLETLSESVELVKPAQTAAPEPIE